MDEGELRDLDVDVTVDCQGEVCPGPVLKTMEALEGMAPGQVMVLVTDLEVATQSVSVAVQAGGLAAVLGVVREDGLFRLYLRKIA